MASRPIDVYLNDHLAGATMGSDLADQIRTRHEGSPLGDVMSSIAPQIDEDRRALEDLLERMGTTRNQAKQAVTWCTEKVTRIRFSAIAARDRDQAALLALETLSLGVLGKAKLWEALIAVADEYPPLAAAGLDQLLARAQAQHAALEQARRDAATRSLGTPG
ncbi:MAG: hypothetical protein WAL63_17505 [Solirubrobacteraceae bacterium]